MTEAAVRWQSPSADLTIPGLAFRDLRFDGEPGRPAGARELTRQAHALGRFVTDPRHAHAFKLVAPGAPLPRGVVQASPPLVQSVRVTRRAAPDGRIQFDLIGEVTQSCSVQQAGEMFDMTGGCTVVIDPAGTVRYAIYKRFDSEARRARQHAAIHGPLKDFWRRERRRFVPVTDVLWRLHGAPAPRRRART
jgi:hypothetical protein